MVYLFDSMAINGKKHIPNGKKRIIKFRGKLSWKNAFLYGFLILFSLFILSALTGGSSGDNKTVPVSQLINDTKKGQVISITVNSDKFIATERNGATIQAVREPGTDIYTLFKDAGTPLNNVKVTVKDETTFNNLISLTGNLLPVIAIIAFFYFILRQARGTQESIFSFGQSRAKLFNRDNPKVTFADVAGVD